MAWQQVLAQWLGWAVLAMCLAASAGAGAQSKTSPAVAQADKSQERQRLLDNAQALVDAVAREMKRRCSGAVFGELLGLLVPTEPAIEEEVRKCYASVAPMSIKASDKVKKVLVHPGFPMDARHNSKIRNEDLQAWAATQVKALPVGKEKAA